MSAPAAASQGAPPHNKDAVSMPLLVASIPSFVIGICSFIPIPVMKALSSSAKIDNTVVAFFLCSSPGCWTLTSFLALVFVMPGFFGMFTFTKVNNPYRREKLLATVVASIVSFVLIFIFLTSASTELESMRSKFGIDIDICKQVGTTCRCSETSDFNSTSSDTTFRTCTKFGSFMNRLTYFVALGPVLLVFLLALLCVSGYTLMTFKPPLEPVSETAIAGSEGRKISEVNPRGSHSAPKPSDGLPA